jgi:hypothetical protein
MLQPISQTQAGNRHFIELKLYRNGVVILSVLNDKKHDNRNNRRQSADNELPGNVEMKP